MGLEGRRILLGVTGGIAAYKTPLLARLLVTAGAEVRALMTGAAARFVTATTLEVVTRHSVHADLFERSDEFPVLHVGLGEWAELLLVAPATANTIGKMANGIGDDLLSSVLLTAGAPVLLAPAMEEGMLENPHVQRNISLLRQHGAGWIEPEEGELASGAHGRGRMASPEAVVAAVEDFLDSQGGPGEPGGLRRENRAGDRGPDPRRPGPRPLHQQPLDRKDGVRRRRPGCPPGSLGEADQRTCRPPASRRSRGRACSQCRGDAGGCPEVVPGGGRRHHGSRPFRIIEPRSIPKTRSSGLPTGSSWSWSPTRISRRNWERARGTGSLSPSPWKPKRQRPRPAKLARKKSDLIALNNLREEGAGFGVDTNVVTLIDAEGREEALPKMSKMEVADRLLDRVRELLATRRKSG